MELSEAIFFNLIMTFSGAFLADVEPLENHSPEPVYLQEMYCLALNTYHEARGEDFESKLAVAQAVMNRVNDRQGEFRRHNTVCGVIKRAHLDEKGRPMLHRCWYSWYCDGNSNHVRLYKAGKLDILEKKAWKESILTSFYAFHDLYRPLVDDSTHYFNFNTVNPSWADSYEFVTDVGPHRFMR